MTYIKHKDRYADRYIYGHRAALRYLGLKDTVSNIMMLRRSKIGVQRGVSRKSKNKKHGASPKYYYSQRKLDELFRKIVIETLRELTEDD